MVMLNFLLSEVGDTSLKELSECDPFTEWPYFLTGERCWSLKTCLVLKQKGKPAKLSRTYDLEAINLAHPQFVNANPPASNVFLASLQADYPYCRLAHKHVVQNQCQARGPDRIWLPHWPMDGLRGRESGRDVVTNVGYMGNDIFLADGKSTWRSMLDSFGMDFKVMDESNCNDFSDVDIVVGVRSFDRRSWPKRPGWKLINAWHAKVPFIGGWDSAYRQIGDPGKDYLRVESRRELLDAIYALRSDPARYHALVDAGKQKAERYNTESIAEDWARFIQNDLEPSFKLWSRGYGRSRSHAKRIVWAIERGVRSRVSGALKNRKLRKMRPGRLG